MKYVPPIGTIGRAVLGRKGLGFVPDQNKPVGSLGLGQPIYKDVDQLDLATPIGTAGYSVEHWMPEPADQGAANSCVGFAIATCEIITLRARHNIGSERPSERWLYYWARWDDGHLADVGCWPALALASAAQRGVVLASQWPYSVSKINEAPPSRLRFDALERRGYRDSYEVLDRGDMAVEACRAALASRRAFAIGIPWDSRLHRGQPTTYEGPRGTGRGFHWDEHGKPIGNHMITCVAMEYHRGEWWTRYLNSHGPEYNGDGTGWLSEEYLRKALSILVIDPKAPAR